ncbi:amino acid transporter [Colletotrichum camelliae]|nr:amino acid transporter [Colletotrichum camelliae]
MGGTIQDVEVQDEVFGAITKDGPNYRALGWKGSIVVMLKTQIGLGVLTIPKVFAVLGLIPGIICVIVVASMITWANYVVGAFKLRHPNVYGIEDVGRMLMGKFGYEFFGWLFAIYADGECLVRWAFDVVQTLGRISWLAWVGFGSILSALLVLTISVGVQDRPAAAPQTNTTWASDYVLFANPTPSEAFAAVSSIVFSYAGTPAFFHIVAEMRDPRMYTRAMMVLYYFCGTYVTSPVLGSAGPLMKRICYGLALPGLTVSSALFVHFTGKYLFLRFMRGSSHLTRNSVTHWAVWIGCTGVNALLSYIVASAIPILSGLVSLVGAFGGTLLSLQPMGAMWLYDNWNGKRTPLWMLTFAWVVFVIVMGSFMTVAGSYGAIVGIINDYKASGGSAAWSCADNSSS